VKTLSRPHVVRGQMAKVYLGSTEMTGDTESYLQEGHPLRGSNSW